MSMIAQSMARLRGLVNDREGGVLLVTAIALPVLVGFAGIGVEASLWYGDKRELQTAADAAALSGAFERVRGNPEDLESAARYEAERNGFAIQSPNTIAINNPPTAGSKTGETTAVEVVLTRRHPLLFTSLFMARGVTISARAVAAVDVTGEACVLALDRTASAALNNQGSSTVNMTGCVMASNSVAANAIQVSGSANVTAFSLWTTGGAVIDGSASLTVERPPTTNAWDLDDPWADLTIPPYTGCDITNLNVTTSPMTIGPASSTDVFVICGRVKLTSSDTLILKPGTYIINKGDLELMAGSTLKCACPNPEDGVTIILTSSGSASEIGVFKIDGNANVDLRAPSDGSNPFRGVLFYQDRRAPPTATAVNKLNGTSSMKLQGAIYIPQQGVEFNGNSGAQSCTQIVARTVSFTGNSYIDNSGCKDAGVQPVSVTQARLAE